jgi:hypothetical protein
MKMFQLRVPIKEYIKMLARDTLRRRLMKMAWWRIKKVKACLTKRKMSR